MAGKDYYSVLGVSKNAKAEEIKVAFRKLAHQHHPDKGGDANKFKEINEAYQVLGNEQKRKQYDQFGSAFPGGQAGDFYRSGGFDFSNSNVNFEDLGDLFGGFGDMFGFSSRSDRSESNQAGGQIEAVLLIDFKEAVFGVEKEIIVDKNIKCDRCQGQGAEPGSRIETCSTCRGRGKILKTQRTIFGAFQTEALCSACDGSGQTFSKKCSQCGGQGIHSGQERLKVKIPAGIDDGEAIRLSGRGHSGQRNSSAGDLILRIKIKADQNFIRRDYNIYSKIKIKVKQAVLGDKIEVDTVHGQVKLKIPEGTQSGTVFKLKGKGVPKLKGIGHGDHLLEVLVDIPKGLSRRAKKVLEDIDF